MSRMTDEEQAAILKHAQPLAGPPKNPLKFLASKKGIQTMKEQAKRLRQLAKDGKLKEEEPMADWLSKPFRKPPNE